MNILISLFFSITLALGALAEDIKIIELHDQTIDQILLNAASDEGDENDDVKSDISNEELITTSSSMIEFEFVNSSLFISFFLSSLSLLAFNNI